MIQIPDISAECVFKAVRSGGKGGQHVNKVSTKVELYFAVRDSQLLSQEQKEKIIEKLPAAHNEACTVRITSDRYRSQLKNKEDAISKLHSMLIKALTPQKKRIKTKTPRSVVEKRIADKKRKSDVKSNRRKPDAD